jgi:hypothetical protein
MVRWEHEAYWHNQRGCWVGRFSLLGKCVHVGVYETAEEASAAVRARIAEHA